MKIFHRLCSFRGDLLEIDQPDTRIVYGGHVCYTDRDDMSNRYNEDLPEILPIKFRFIWLSGFKREIILEIN